MDPALFRVDWDVLFEALATLVVLSFLVERALAVVFENRVFLRVKTQGAKEMIAIVVSYAVVQGVDFDVFAILFHLDHASKWGLFMTAAIVAGGSKASIKLFHDVLDIKGKALRESEAGATDTSTSAAATNAAAAPAAGAASSSAARPVQSPRAAEGATDPSAPIGGNGARPNSTSSTILR